MSKNVYHVHHIVPRHAGGTDDPSNLVRLTVEEHAEAHRILYEEHGRIEDKLAWKFLSGKTSEAEELRIKLAVEGFKRFTQSPEFENFKSKLSNTMKGKIHSEESNIKRSKTIKQGIAEGKYRKPKKRDPQWYIDNINKNRDKLNEARKNSEIWKKSHQNNEYRESQRKLMLDRNITWGSKISDKKLGKKTKATISIKIADVEYHSVKYAARILNISSTVLYKLARKYNNIIPIEEITSRNPFAIVE